jgi:hypothetical protein
MVSERASQRAFFGVSALLFAAASAAVTISSGARPCRRWARDADARTDAARRRGVVARHVGSDDDGSDDAAILGANAVAL